VKNSGSPPKLERMAKGSVKMTSHNTTHILRLTDKGLIKAQFLEVRKFRVFRAGGGGNSLTASSHFMRRTRNTTWKERKSRASSQIYFKKDCDDGRVAKMGGASGNESVRLL